MDLLLNTILLEPNRWTADKELTWPLVDLLDPVAAAGFTDLELWGYHVDRLDDAGIEGLRQGLAERSQRALAVGAYPAFHLDGAEDEAEVARLERVVGVSATLGARLFKIFPGRVGSAQADDAIRRRSVERLRALADRTAQAGMRLTLETHGNTLCDTLDSTQRLFDELGEHDNVGLCFQPYTEQDTDAAIAMFDTLGDRVWHVHLQNRDEARTATRLAEGSWTDYGRFLPHVRDSGFDGTLCIEFTAGIVPADGESFDLQQVIGNAAADRAFVEAAWSR